MKIIPLAGLVLLAGPSGDEVMQEAGNKLVSVWLIQESGRYNPSVTSPTQKEKKYYGSR